MSILGNLNKLIEDDDNESSYVTPAVIRDEKISISFKKALVLSTILHPTVIGLFALLTFVLALLGINLLTAERPKPKMNDIEFVLVDKEATPINKKTPYRADKNSRAGGIHDPKRKVSMPSPQQAVNKKPSAPSPAPQKKDNKKSVQKALQKTFNKTPQPQVAQTPVKKPTATPQRTSTSAPAKPAPPSARPSLAPVAAPKVTTTPKTPFTVPVPPNANAGRLATGPVGGSSTVKKPTTGGSGGGGKYAPTPTLAPSYGSKPSSGAGTAGRTGSQGGSGNYGNPGPGNPNGRPGIDAVREPDFGPYMRDLQRRIKMNWDPPKGNESKRVVLLFKIARDGRLLSSRVYKSSGLTSADQAALNAVQLTAPFRPLPADFKGASIDIQFTFDYNVFGASGYN